MTFQLLPVQLELFELVEDVRNKVWVVCKTIVEHRNPIPQSPLPYPDSTIFSPYEVINSGEGIIDSLEWATDSGAGVIPSPEWATPAGEWVKDSPDSLIAAGKSMVHSGELVIDKKDLSPLFVFLKQAF